ncbi:TetR/AcrR family transcriptional regulator [Sphingomonas sp.]|uniref:TetR/AcrR family transcriptional regulator n=1 Tax=Sphingomonas sp. TaxID=28214 RepID=UPI00261AC4DD|nr:TetR/AcrR family transcriptional regulator [Sphingomonas sp.]MDF2495228.1 hypothetical protein [Sphingomonas sp.]
MIQAAREAFAANGFHGTGMAQIAQTSGIAVGQIYRDFANKEAIVAEIVARDLENFLSERGLCAAGATGDPAAVREWIEQFVACENPEGGRLVAEIMAEASRNERTAEIVRTVQERMRGELTSALRLLVPATVSPSRFACVAQMIQTISAGVFQRRVTEQDQPSADVIRSLMNCINAAIDGLQHETAEDADRDSVSAQCS